MACFHPIPAYRLFDGSVSFKRCGDIVADLTLPCGQCIGCRLERSRQWAVRCMHEAELHQDSCFITLTYDDQYLPSAGSLKVDDFQRFMKRFRKDVSPRRIRFFHCGEYGDLNRRPHYHALIFGFDFDDKIPTVAGSDLFISARLRKLWPFGHSTIGRITFESAAYVARYSLKKVNGPAAETHYSRIIPETGEIVQISPEYTTMSRRPGIGSGWFDKFSSDVYPSDEVIVSGRKSRPPRYYDKLLDKRGDGLLLDQLKFQREQKSKAHVLESEPDRLAVREGVARGKARLKSRSV